MRGEGHLSFYSHQNREHYKTQTPNESVAAWKIKQQCFRRTEKKTFQDRARSYRIILCNLVFNMWNVGGTNLQQETTTATQYRDSFTPM